MRSFPPWRNAICDDQSIGIVEQISTMLSWIPCQWRFFGHPYFIGTTPNKFFIPSVTPAQW
jgi:hypothetical protein